MSKPIYSKRERKLGEAIYRRVLEKPIASIVAEFDPNASPKLVDAATVYAFGRARTWKDISADYATREWPDNASRDYAEQSYCHAELVLQAVNLHFSTEAMATLSDT